MKLTILITLLSLNKCSSTQVATLNGDEQFEEIDNNLEPRKKAYETALLNLDDYGNQRYESAQNHVPKDRRNNFRNPFKTNQKKTKTKDSSKLKFRNYKQKKDDRPRPVYFPEKKLRNFKLTQSEFGDAEIDNQLERRNRSVGENRQQALKKLAARNWVDERLNEQIEGDGSDGFSFKNLMPLWKPFDALRKINKPPSVKAEKESQLHKNNALKNLELLKDNFFLLPEQNKLIFIKTLDHDKKLRTDHFDNLAHDGVKVIKIGGKSDLRLEIEDDDDKKKAMPNEGACQKIEKIEKVEKTEGVAQAEEEKNEETSSTTTTTEVPQASTMRPGCVRKPEHGSHEEHRAGNGKHEKGHGGNGEGHGGHEEDHGGDEEHDEQAGKEGQEEQQKQSKPEDVHDAEKEHEENGHMPTCVTTATTTSTTSATITAATDATDILIPTEILDTTVPSEESENLEKDLKEQILSCTADKLEKYLKSLKIKCGSNEQQQSNSVSKLPERKLHTVHDSVVPINTQSDATLENMLKHLTKADLLRLNITINGLVMGDEKPSHIRGNATIHLLPAKAQADRSRRGIKLPFLKHKRKDKANEEECTEETKKCDDEKVNDGCKKKCTTVAPDTDLSKDAMSSFQISNEIIKMVSQMVHSNPKMKTLWPSLKRQKPGDNKKTAAAIRKLCKGPGRKRLEEMIRRAMSSVDEIIEQEVQQRSCAPLSEDLQNFYELILSLHAKQAKRTEEREERLSKSENLEEENSPTCEPDSKDSCDKNNDGDDVELNENSLFDIIHERKLQYDQEMSEVRHSREAIRRNRDLEADTANSTLVRRLREGYSPAFLKLHEVADAIDRATVGAEAP